MTDLQHISDSLRPLAVPIDTIAPDDNNAMGHSPANLQDIADSLARFGQRKPVVVNRRTGKTEAGAGTWEAAKLLGWSHIAVSWEDDDPEIAEQFGVADNAVASSEWNAERLQEIVERAQAMGEETPGMDEGRLRAILDASIVPDFQPVSGDEQPRLDRKKPVYCPHCGANIHDDVIS